VEPRPWTWRTWALFGILAVAWGLNYPFVVVGLTASGPLWLAALRSAVGLAGTCVLVTALRGWGALDARGRRDAFLLGVPNTALFFGLWFAAAGSVPPGVASVVVYTFPLWVALLSAPVLGRPLGRWAWASVGVGFLGVAVIARFWLLVGHDVSPLPIVELLLAALSWGVGTVLFQRRFAAREILSATALQLAGGCVALAVAAILLTPTPLPRATVDLGLALLWMGLVGTAVAYSIWFTLLVRTPAAQVSAYLFLVPVVALVASAIAFHEGLGADQLVGVALVLVAIYGVGRSRLGASPTAEGRSMGPPLG
jgi:drug/metabolite transporter (DMT)-like permease